MNPVLTLPEKVNTVTDKIESISKGAKKLSEDDVPSPNKVCFQHQGHNLGIDYNWYRLGGWGEFYRLWDLSKKVEKFDGIIKQCELTHTNNNSE